MGKNGKLGQPMTPEQRAKLPLSKVFAICRQQAHSDFGGQEPVDYVKKKLREAYTAAGLKPSERGLEFTAQLFVDSAREHVNSVRAKQQKQWEEIFRRHEMVAEAFDDFSKSGISIHDFYKVVDVVFNGKRHNDSIATPLTKEDI